MFGAAVAKLNSGLAVVAGAFHLNDISDAEASVLDGVTGNERRGGGRGWRWR